MIEKKNEYRKLIEVEGSYVSPMVDLIPGAMCSRNRIGRFQMIVPKQWRSNFRPVCFHYAGTGDHSYYRRRVFLANQLLDDGIASVILMNPFYGTRMPMDQKGSALNYLSDLFVMGGALILECHTLLQWCQKQGYGPFALHGISMGGYMATICATTVPFPISLIPCLSSTSASVVFVKGVLSHSVDWKTLTKQYVQDSFYSKVLRPKIQPSIRPDFVLKAKKQAVPSSWELTSDASEGDKLAAEQLLVHPPKNQRTPDYIIDFLGLYRQPFSNISKLLAYVKSHNRLHLYFDNHIWDSAMSAVRAVPMPSVFPDKLRYYFFDVDLCNIRLVSSPEIVAHLTGVVLVDRTPCDLPFRIAHSCGVAVYFVCRGLELVPE
ncbi:unnamed protein product [Mesocestoides corti]|uniref:Uncharacterized protein n=1 Tax=Mesocestoides corti TaxID=53468 RepID=A0A0R3ULL3_MESCO|nr:unnamed protein product [Mesocestoides corti]